MRRIFFGMFVVLGVGVFGCGSADSSENASHEVQASHSKETLQPNSGQIRGQASGAPACEAPECSTAELSNLATKRSQTVAGPFRDSVVKLARTPSGNLLAAILDSRTKSPNTAEGRSSDSTPLSLIEYDAQGNVVSTRTIPEPGAPLNVAGLVASADGAVYLSVDTCFEFDAPCVPGNFGGGEMTGPRLVKLGPSGEFVWQHRESGNVAGPVSLDASGSPVVLSWERCTAETCALPDAPEKKGFVSQYTSEGAVAWTQSAMPDVESVVAHPSGGIFIGNRRGEILLLGGDGNPAWPSPKKASSGKPVAELAASRSSDALLALSYDVYGPAELTSLSLDGQPRWNQPVDTKARHLAVDAQGRAAFIGEMALDCGAWVHSVHFYGENGQRLSTRSFDAEGGNCNGPPYHFAALEFAAEGLTIGGHSRTLPSGQVDALILNLAP